VRLPSRAALGMFGLLLALQLPWLGKHLGIDEPKFVTLARAAARDPWRPHDVEMHWAGHRQRAFDFFSNPPGVAWWLAPVSHAPVPVQRAWMLPWLLPAIWGARRLGRRFGGGDSTALLLLVAPIVVVATASLLPDAPLYACTLAGVGGYVTAVDRGRSPFAFAVLAGCAALFRYSGVALMPLLALYSLLRRRPPWPALGAWIPIGLLALHDLNAYGAWHFAAIYEFQSVSNSARQWLHKGAAALAMLGGAAALPVFAWRWPGLVGAVLGAVALAGLGWAAAAFGAAGGATLGTALWWASGSPDERADRLWLAAWAAGGFVFLLTLRFVAARYWVPFVPGVLLALPRGRWAPAAIGASALLGVALVATAHQRTQAIHELADRVADLGTGYFTGQWGWAWAMQQHGWRPLDTWSRAPTGALVAMPKQAWPQMVAVACDEVVLEAAAKPSIPWLPRDYTAMGRANLHASSIVPGIAGLPPTPTVLPWSFASDPYERVRVCRDDRPLEAAPAPPRPAADLPP
jgi:hypothetical protein